MLPTPPTGADLRPPPGRMARLVAVICMASLCGQAAGGAQFMRVADTGNLASYVNERFRCPSGAPNMAYNLGLEDYIGQSSATVMQGKLASTSMPKYDMKPATEIVTEVKGDYTVMSSSDAMLSQWKASLMTIYECTSYYDFATGEYTAALSGTELACAKSAVALLWVEFTQFACGAVKGMSMNWFLVCWFWTGKVGDTASQRLEGAKNPTGAMSCSTLETSVPTPATEVPATPVPPTPAPHTTGRTTSAPATTSPPTPLPETPVPPTPAPHTMAPQTPAPSSPAPPTPAPQTTAPATLVPPTHAPMTPAPSTPAPSTTAPSSPAPSTLAPLTTAPPTTAPATPAPATPAPSTPALNTPAPSTPVPPTPAPLTPTPPVPPTPAPHTMMPMSAPTSAPTPMPMQTVTDVPPAKDSVTAAPATPMPMHVPLPPTTSPATTPPATPAPSTPPATTPPATAAPATSPPTTTPPATAPPATTPPATTAPSTASPATAVPPPATPMPMAAATPAPTWNVINTEEPLPITTVPGTPMPMMKHTPAPDTAAPAAPPSTLVPLMHSGTPSPGWAITLRVPYDWVSLGVKLRSIQWPATYGELLTLVDKMAQTFILVWAGASRRPAANVAITLICPLDAEGKKPVGEAARLHCQYPTKSLASRDAAVLGSGVENGVFAEVLLRDTSASKVQEDEAAVVAAIDGSALQRPPLYDPQPSSEYLPLSPIAYGDGSNIARVQGGVPFTTWQAKRAENWEEPVAPPSPEPVLPWWTWVVMSGGGLFTLVGIASLLAIKRPKQQEGKGAVTVSDFYRSMPHEGGYQAPIPEEHYCLDDGVASSVELESNRSLRDFGFGFVQPVGKI